MDNARSASPKPKVFAARRLPGDAHLSLADSTELSFWKEPFPPPREALLSAVAETEGLLTLITDRIDEELLSRAPRLRVVSNMGVGVDNIDVGACTARGIPVGNTPGVLTDATADLAFALLLAAARRLTEATAFVQAGKWKTWDPSLLLGRDVCGATLGIVGLGKIGLAVARRARGFGMRILYTGTAKPDAERETGAQRVSKEALLRDSDFVSLHLPLTPQTRHYLGEKEFALMKSTAILINTARGPVVDQRALVQSLKRGHPGGAALDVTDPEPIASDDPLLALPNVIVLPHLGSATDQTRAKMARMAVDNLRAGLAGKRLPNCVNPEVFGRST
jgi:glyoxylate reductase